MKIVFKFLCLVLYPVITLIAAEDSGIVRIPLQHMESGLQKLMRQGADIKLIEGIYEMSRKGVVHNKLVVRGDKPVIDNTTLALYKYFDTEYYGTVNIGKHAFKMVMDTTWSYTWVISNDCPRTLIQCAVHNRYDHKSSPSYQPDGRTFNVSNKFIGYMSKDDFVVGQLKSKGQGFAEVTSVPWIYALYNSDGTIGLGLPELSHNATSFFSNFNKQNNLKEPVFSFYINRDPTTTRGGSLFFGGIDTKHNKSAFSTIQINSPYYWQFHVDKVSVVISIEKKINFCQNGCNAIADTSSSSIVGPAEEIKEINRLIGAEKVFFSDRYLIPCTQEYKGPKILFTVGKDQFLMKGQDYVLKLSYSGFTVCLSAFRAADSTYQNNTWSLGGAFFYQYYTAYNIINRTIMIAEAA